MSSQPTFYKIQNDKPILSIDDDQLDVKRRIVDRVIHFLERNYSGSFTIAITGEWGSGKTSAMNMLAQNLCRNEKNIIIQFEPLLEGKLTVPEIMELFYLKLLSAPKLEDSEIKQFIKKSLASLITFSFTGTTLSLSDPTGIANCEIDLDKKIENLSKIWEKNPQTFAEQTGELNKKLTNKEYKLFVFIDEIDRLPAHHIINFLMFARILETFDNLICIVGIDYLKALQSLQSDSNFTFQKYEKARDYLDKLFYIQFHIHHDSSNTLTPFVYQQIKALNNEKLNEIIASRDNEIQSDLISIVSYLKTPRQIKKWLALISINILLINYYPSNISLLLALFAVCVKHPFALYNIASHTLPMLSFRHMDSLFLLGYIKNKYKRELTLENHKEIFKKIICPSIGLIRSKEQENNLSIKILDVYQVDLIACDYMEKALDTLPPSLLISLVQGYIDEESIKVSYLYFNSNPDKAIQWFIDNDDILIASEISHVLHKKPAKPTKPINLELLNELWARKIINNRFTLLSPYKSIVLFSLGMHPIEEVIEKVDLGLSEEYIENILKIFNLKKEKSNYNINDFQEIGKDTKYKILPIEKSTFNGEKAEKFDKDTIIKILIFWVNHFEKKHDENIIKNIKSYEAFKNLIEQSNQPTE